MQLKTYLDKRGLTILEFACLLGVSHQAVRRYLHGERLPQRDIMLRIAKVTKGKVRPDDWLLADRDAA